MSIQEVLRDVEAECHEKGEPTLEAELSINEWIRRIQEATKTAHMQARTGDAVGQYKTWVEITGICARRAELLLAMID